MKKKPKKTVKKVKKPKVKTKKWDHSIPWMDNFDFWTQQYIQHGIDKND